MDRVSGVYKRHLKQISFFVGGVLVLVVNADSLKVARSLWNDSALRATMVQTATTFANGMPQGSSPANTNAALAANNAGGQAAPAPSSDVDASVNAAVQGISDAEQNLRPLPLGWSLPSLPPWLWQWHLLAWSVVVKIIGLLLTAIAISLGAPFWFDLLSMFMKSAVPATNRRKRLQHSGGRSRRSGQRRARLRQEIVAFRFGQGRRLGRDRYVAPVSGV